MDYYVLFIWGDVEPQLYGPYDQQPRDGYAQLLRFRGEENGVYTLDVSKAGIPVVGTYTGPTPEERKLPDIKLVRGLSVIATGEKGQEFLATVQGVKKDKHSWPLITVTDQDDDAWDVEPSKIQPDNIGGMAAVV